MYDLAVIGSGPGGYVAAIRAAQLGLKTACIEKNERLGGTCLNVGCIPSKALLQSSEHFYFIKEQAKEHGIDVSSIKLDFDAMMKRKTSIVDGLTNGIASLFKQNKVDWIKGEARFKEDKTLEVNGKAFEAKNILIATGSEPIALPFLPFDEKRVLSSTGALQLKEVPESLLVIGAGVIGLELASVYRRLGAKVTLVEMLDEIASGMDGTISRTLQQILTKQGLEFILKAKVIAADLSKPKIEIQLEDRTLEADKVLVGIGRKPYTKNLNFPLNARGRIEVNNRFQTGVPNVYAIGDVIEGPMLAHKASEEGVVAVELIAGHRSKIDYITIPNVIYTSPEAVSIGFTEKELKEKNVPYVIGQCSFKAVSRARCMGETEGLIKLLAEKESKKLLGYHVIGPNASELAAEGVMALTNKMTLEAIGNASHAHPTLSEGIKEAALNGLKRQIHF